MITAEQHARDLTWLPVPPLHEINAALASLQSILDAAQLEFDRLRQIIQSDVDCRWPGWERYLESPVAKLAYEQFAAMSEIPGYHSTNAADYIRRRPNRLKQKYPIKQWEALASRLRVWIKKAQKIT